MTSAITEIKIFMKILLRKAVARMNVAIVR